MRDLTEKELARCPDGCDYYHVINNQVLFTNVLGVGVFDIHGNKVDDSILDGAFQKSKPIKKPFSIMEHRFSDTYFRPWSANDEVIELELEDDGVFGYVQFNKQDAIAMAKHFNLTAEDLER